MFAPGSSESSSTSRRIRRAQLFYFFPLLLLAGVDLHLKSFRHVSGPGMPILPQDSDADYLRRQVVTSRNIRGGRLVTAWMGGLDYQIEHHLFPSMPRPHLEAASRLTRSFCAERRIECTEVGVSRAWAAIARHLREAGIADALHPFECPAARRFGR